ncbi:TPA: hypothetical protein ACX6RC_001293 [Photobacterium damselae]
MKIKTINDYLDSYLTERRFSVSPSTQRSEASKANNIRKAIGKRAIDSVLHSDLETYQQTESLQNEQIQVLTRQNTVLETQLDNCRTDAVQKSEANGLLQADLDHVRQQLTILSTKYESVARAEEKSLARLDELTAQLAESQMLSAVLSERVSHLESSLKTHEVVT